MSEKIRGIFFDFGGTLFDYYPSNVVIWANIAKRLGFDISPSDPRIRRGIRKQIEAFEKLGKPFSELSSDELHILNSHVLKALGIETEGTKETIVAEFKAREQGKQHTIYPDTLETLRNIKEIGIRIGLLSNTDHRLALSRRPTLKENGILHYFDIIILSVEVGVQKPQKEIFDIALREIGIKNPAQVMHIGDSPIEDVWGARNAGFIPVLFDPMELFSTENVIKIKTLSDILHYLK
ncbi:MAG: HAD family hydrolase [Candidatus Odinarchaeota archaeon]